MQLADLDARFAELGALPQHRSRVLRHWLQAIPLTQGRKALEHFLPKALREALPGLMAEWQGLVSLHTREPAADGSERLLFTLKDGQSVEAVLLPQRDKAWGLCVSSQVGCAVGCGFCMTGTGGLIRQLSTGEILAQVAAARGLRAVNKVVFMGMGEPSHNLEAVLEAIQVLGTEGGIGHKSLVFSTVGDERAFERLASASVKPALALSLHTTRAALRQQLLPRAPRLSPQELVGRADAYGRASGYPVQYQWTLLAGVNDAEDDEIVALLGGRYGVLNLIPFNRVEGLPFERPEWEACRDMVRRLHQRGILTKLRDSAGQDVEGGCGQLRARIQAERPIKLHRPAQ
ncbi:23S rRNA (adenine2503-C2)-methyltransferase [Inhella inkyongensis]|uniref:23S rRNA (Adenine2503-C2)-methyltransferase n=1 Tax=Inhella inkyongensis TaxID=392593 RepID=A0A840SA35_9BURK|nr:RNA methyltransferase [Inhella inkyongensis]MBB5206388.1 23S rRNA (adenine2503-C2)-methyltransferase [Inhella inkyongensis]